MSLKQDQRISHPSNKEERDEGKSADDSIIRSQTKET